MGRSRLGATLLSALVVTVATAVAAPAASAATISVTTTADGGPGSLRAALDRANTSATPTTIVLVRGLSYDLTICDGDSDHQDDTNQSGDLDVLATQPVTLKGRGATIRQTCPDADHERVLDLRGAGAVALDEVTVTGGFTGGPLDPFSSGIGGGIRSTSALNLDRVTISDNSSATAGGLWTDHALVVRRSSISDNVAKYSGGGVVGIGGVTIEQSRVTRNKGSNAGGLGARGGLTMTLVTVTENEATDGVAGTYVEGAASIDRSTIAGNVSLGPVGGLGGLDFGADPGTVHVTRTTISGNRATNGAGAAFQGVHAVFEHTTITDNHAMTSTGGVALIGSTTVELRYSTVTANEAPLAANLGIVATDTTAGPTIELFATVVASPLGTGSNCGVIDGDGSAVIGPLDVTSTGYSYDTDGTCGVGAAPGDISGGSDPRLSSLADHGGPTLTRQPLRGSPLLDVIPVVDPSCTGTDQRNRPRPAGSGCDIGSVEARVRR